MRSHAPQVNEPEKLWLNMFENAPTEIGDRLKSYQADPITVEFLSKELGSNPKAISDQELHNDEVEKYFAMEWREKRRNYF